MILIPPYLKPGDTVGIVATARWITDEQLEPGIRFFEEQGYRVKLGKYLSKKNFQLAGSDEERAADMQEMLDDSSVRAIMIARGGYGTVRVIDKLRWNNWLEYPSWICGYSDITVLLSHVNNLNVASIHSTMPISFPDATDAAMNNLARALSGRLEGMSWDTACGGDFEVTGNFIGGNLSVLYSLMGSSSYPNLGGGILFVEDVDEMIYHVDRMMEGLKRGGGFTDVKAIVVGGLTLMKDNTIEHSFPIDNPFGGDALSAIQRVAADLGIPVIDGFPAGHMSDNRAFYNGREVRLILNQGKATLTWI